MAKGEGKGKHGLQIADRGLQMERRGGSAKFTICNLRSAIVCSSLGLLPVLLASCSNLNPAMTAGIDPLLGGPPLSNPAPSKPQPAAAVTALPPPPAPGLTMSNAALAVGTPRPLDASRDLRIGNPRTNPANDSWAGQGSPTPSNGSGAVLRGPEPVTEPAPQPDTNPAYSPAARASSPSTTLEQVKAQLAARSVVWQKLEKSGTNDEWKFTCSVPNRQNPKLRRTYVATARDELAAMRAVLDQIDKDQ